MLDEHVNLKEHRADLIEKGIAHMKSGGTLTQFKDKMKEANETHGTVVYVSEKILDHEFQRSINGGFIAKLNDGLGVVMGLLIIGIGVFAMVYTWQKGYIAIWPFGIIGIGLFGLTKK